MTQMTSEMCNTFSILTTEQISHVKVCLIDILKYGQDGQFYELE